MSPTTLVATATQTYLDLAGSSKEDRSEVADRIFNDRIDWTLVTRSSQQSDRYQDDRYLESLADLVAVNTLMVHRNDGIWVFDWIEDRSDLQHRILAEDIDRVSDLLNAYSPCYWIGATG